MLEEMKETKKGKVKRSQTKILNIITVTKRDTKSQTAGPKEAAKKDEVKKETANVAGEEGVWMAMAGMLCQGISINSRL